MGTHISRPAADLRPNAPRTQPPLGPACKADPESWSLDHGGLPDWLRAIRICVTGCPLVQQCWDARNRLYPTEHPVGVIWAGTAYTDTGEPLLTQQALVEYASEWQLPAPAAQNGRGVRGSLRPRAATCDA
jgi:hypothetical protein